MRVFQINGSETFSKFGIQTNGENEVEFSNTAVKNDERRYGCERERVLTRVEMGCHL